MSNLKIAEIFKTFTKSELADFERFAKSTYFSRGRNYLPLIGIIKKFHPDFDNRDFNKQFIYRKLYPQKKYNDQVLRNLFSGLLKTCEYYMLFKNISESKFQYFRILAAEFNHRMMYNYSEKYINVCNEILKESGIDKYYFKNLFELQQLKREILQSRGNANAGIENLSSEAIDFLLFTLLETNSLIEEMVVYNHNFNADFENHLVFKFINSIDLDNLQNSFEAGRYHDSEISKLYITHTKLLTDYRNEKLFETFKKLLEKNINLLSHWGKYNMFLCLENACIRLQELDEAKYRKILLDVYKEQLKRNVYNPAQGSSMDVDMFRNIIVNALRLEQYSWVESFIEKYIEIVLPEHRDNMYNFTYSLLNFEKGNFEKSLSYISKVRFDTFVFKFDVKVLSLMIYFESGYLEAAISMIDSFRHFIMETQSISDYVKEIHLNFVKFLNEIIRIKTRNKSYDENLLTLEIQETKTRNKEWLLEKVSLLKNEL